MRVLIFTILAVLLLPLILLGYLIFSGAFAAYVFHKISPELPMNPMVVVCICMSLELGQMRLAINWPGTYLPTEA